MAEQLRKIRFKTYTESLQYVNSHDGLGNDKCMKPYVLMSTLCELFRRSTEKTLIFIDTQRNRKKVFFETPLHLSQVQSARYIVVVDETYVVTTRVDHNYPLIWLLNPCMNGNCAESHYVMGVIVNFNIFNNHPLKFDPAACLCNAAPGYDGSCMQIASINNIYLPYGRYTVSYTY
jgi:hypothetical protein